MATLYNSIMNRPQSTPPYGNDIIRAPSTGVDSWIWQMPENWLDAVPDAKLPVNPEDDLRDMIVEQIRARRR